MLVNGQLTNKMSILIGIRQADPLSQSPSFQDYNGPTKTLAEDIDSQIEKL